MEGWLTELGGPPDEPRHRPVEVGVDDLGGRVLLAHAPDGLPQQPVVVLRQAVEPPQAPRPPIIVLRRVPFRAAVPVLGQRHRQAPRRQRPRYHHVPRSLFHQPLR